MKKVRETRPTSTKWVLGYTKAEEKVVINDIYPEQTITIEKQLPEHFKERLRDLMRSNADVFAWTHANMTGIPRTIMGLGPDRSTTTYKEVEELTKVGILQKVKHQTWVANPVMAKKSNGGWRMCVDFTDINKACPKDCYPLPEIDWKVESLLGFRLKCFLDAYKGYHHIQMVKEDEDKTDFFAGKGVFCYRKMPFGLKNARATYQRLVDKVFHDQIGRNLEAYVDDMVIKSTFEEDMLADIKKLLKVPLEESKKEAEGRTNTKSENTKLSCEWKLYTNGAASSDGSGAGLMLIHPEGKELSVVGKSNKGYLRSQATNDQRIPAEDKRVEVLSKRSIEEKEILQVETNEEESWMTPIHEYLVLLHIMASLCCTTDSQHHKRNTRRFQWFQCRATLNGGLNYKARILLAVDAQRRRKVNSRLREMQGTICDKESSRKWCNNS
ncbi:reverse transcriptase domain-containing protein [Tanacetum coccineum]